MRRFKRGLEMVLGMTIVLVGVLFCLTVIFIPLGIPTITVGWVILDISTDERVRIKRDKKIEKDEITRKKVLDKLYKR